MWVKKNLSLVIALSVPFLLIIFIILSVYIPSLFVKPKYNFLFSPDYYSSYNSCGYIIVNNRLTRDSSQSSYCSKYGSGNIRFFVYDVGLDKGFEISKDEAMLYRLDSNRISPDGFEITSSSGSGGFFPFYYGGSYGKKYLTGKSFRKALKLDTGDNFIGWIIE